MLSNLVFFFLNVNIRAYKAYEKNIMNKKNEVEYIVPVYLIKKYSGLLCLY